MATDATAVVKVKRKRPRKKRPHAPNLDIGTSPTREITSRCTKRVIVTLLITMLFSGIAMILLRLGELGEMRAQQELRAMHQSLNSTWKHEAPKLSSSSLVANAVHVEKQLRNKLRSAFSVLPKELELMRVELQKTQDELKMEIGKEKILSEHLFNATLREQNMIRALRFEKKKEANLEVELKQEVMRERELEQSLKKEKLKEQDLEKSLQKETRKEQRLEESLKREKQKEQELEAALKAELGKESVLARQLKSMLVDSRGGTKGGTKAGGAGRAAARGGAQVVREVDVPSSAPAGGAGGRKAGQGSKKSIRGSNFVASVAKTKLQAETKPAVATTKL